MLGKEREVEAREQHPEAQPAEPLAEQATRHLRPPVVDPREEPEEAAADQHVVQVGDHEVAVGLLQIHRRRGVHDARQAADGEEPDQADRVVKRARRPDRAAPERRQPVEDLHPRRNRDEHRRDRERRVGDGAHPGREHVMAPDAEPEEADQHARIDHDGRAEERLARERREHLGDDAERRQDQDVDLGVAEDPEEMLPQVQVAAGRHVEEVGPEETVEHQIDQPDRDRREGQGDQELHHERHPHEDRHAHHGHARRAHVEDRHDEVDGRDDGRDAEDLEAEEPEIDAEAGRVVLRGQVGVAEPADVRRSPDQEARVEQEPAGQEDPVGERVQAWKRDVARADQQRHHVVEEHGVERHDCQEDHRRAVHREERVVGVRARRPCCWGSPAARGSAAPRARRARRTRTRSTP